MLTAYLFVENYHREFRGKFHLGIKMIQERVCDTVYLGDQRDFYILSRAGSLKNSFVLLKSCQPYIYDKVHRLKKCSNVICMQDEEGLVRIELPGNKNASRNDPKIIKLLDRVYCWNHAERNSLASQNSEELDKFILSGNVRTCASVDNNKLYADQLLGVKEVSKRYILIPGNGKIAFGKYHGEGLKSSIDKSMKVNNRDALYTNAIYKWSCNTTASYIEIFSFVNKFRKDFGEEIDIVYRPHPGEDPRLVKILLENLDVIVDTRFSVIPWILNSECVIGAGTTTLLEAAVLGKPTFSIIADIGEGDVGFIKNFPSHKYSVICNDATELYTKVCEFIKHKNFPDRLMEEARCFAGSDIDTTSVLMNEIGRFMKKRKSKEAMLINRLALKAYRLYKFFFSKRQLELMHSMKYSKDNLSSDIEHLKAYAMNHHVSLEMLDKRILILKRS